MAKGKSARQNDNGHEVGSQTPPAPVTDAAETAAHDGGRAAAAGGRLERRVRTTLARGLHFAKEHPTGTVAIAAALGAVAEAQLAAAALVGIGVTALVTKKSGREMRGEVVTWMKWGQARVADLIGRLEQAVAPKQTAPTEGQHPRG